MANYGKLKGIAANIIIMFVVVVIGFYYLFYMYLPSTTNHGETITVPNLYGMSVDEVDKILSENSLNFMVVDSSTFNPSRAPLSVINQVPKADSKVKENRKIYLTINARTAPNVAMPNLVNKSLRDALIVLNSTGLQKDSIIYKPYIFENVVIGQMVKGQKVAEGKLIPKGTKVSLIVGMGSKNNEVVVPDLIGRDYKGLKEYLQGYGLLLSPPRWEKNPDMTEGKVFRQSPTPSDSSAVEKKTVKFGSLIDVWISGEEPKDSTTTP